jgi:predicted metal-dependent peptidase
MNEITNEITQEVKDKIYEKLETARLYLRERLPWFVPVAIRARIVITDALQIPTMGVTENWVLAIHPNMANEPDEVFRACFAHEIVHLALNHCERGKQYHPVIAQVATDLATNSILSSALPTKEFYDIAKRYHMFLPEQFDFPDLLSVEEYAELLMQKIQSQGGGDGEGEGEGKGEGEGEGERKDKKGKGKGMPPLPKNANEGSGATGHEADWEKSIPKDTGLTDAEKRHARRQMAERVAKQWGTAPEWVKLEVRDILSEGKVDWRELLQHYTASRLAISDWDRNYHRFRRPFVEWDILLPVQRPVIGTFLTVVVDTSGSMMDELKVVAAEVKKLLEMFGEIAIVCADTELKGEPKLVRDIGEVDWTGGGGTDMVEALKQVVEYYRTQSQKPDVYILLTDGYCDWGGIEEILEPVIIVCVSDAHIPETANITIVRAKEGD